MSQIIQTPTGSIDKNDLIGPLPENKNERNAWIIEDNRLIIDQDKLIEDNAIKIKNEASKRILLKHPAWKQNNYLARACELQELKLNGESLTEEEESERDFLKSIWAEISYIRNKSNDLEELSKTSELPSDWQNDKYWV